MTSVHFVHIYKQLNPLNNHPTLLDSYHYLHMSFLIPFRFKDLFKSNNIL